MGCLVPLLPSSSRRAVRKDEPTDRRSASAYRIYDSDHHLQGLSIRRRRLAEQPYVYEEG